MHVVVGQGRRKDFGESQRVRRDLLPVGNLVRIQGLWDKSEIAEHLMYGCKLFPFLWSQMLHHLSFFFGLGTPVDITHIHPSLGGDNAGLPAGLDTGF